MKVKTALAILSTFLFVTIATAQTPDRAQMEAQMKANKADPSVIPNSYDFSWKYTMEMQTDSGKSMTATYLLEKNADYFGMNVSQPGGKSMLMIMDTKNKVSMTAFEKGDKKIAMAHNIKDPIEKVEKLKSDKKYTYKSLPDKTILGYKCKGVEATSPEFTMVFYFTNEAPVNFADMYKAQGQKMPEMFSNYFKPTDKPLMMSIDMSDKINNKTTHTKCVALEKSAFTFKKADYKFM